MMMRSPLGNRKSSGESIVPLAILFVILLILLGTPLRVPLRSVTIAVVSPLWSLGKHATGLVQKVIPSVFSSYALAEENARLLKEISILRAESWRSEAIKNERDALRELLGRSTTTKEGLLLAYVLASPNFSPYDTLVLDVGKDTGISSGYKIMTDGGFVIGQITDVMETRSVAQLFSSPGLFRDVLVGSARVPAVAHGIGGGNYRIELPKNTDISEGDEVNVVGEVEEFLGVVERVVVDEKTGITTLFLRLPVNMTEIDSVIIKIPPAYE